MVIRSRVQMSSGTAKFLLPSSTFSVATSAPLFPRRKASGRACCTWPTTCARIGDPLGAERRSSTLGHGGHGSAVATLFATGKESSKRARVFHYDPLPCDVFVGGYMCPKNPWSHLRRGLQPLGFLIRGVRLQESNTLGPVVPSRVGLEGPVIPSEEVRLEPQGLVC